MRPTSIYDATLKDAEIRKYIHAKHLATYKAFYEGKIILFL